MIAIKKVKQISEDLNLTHIIIFAVSADGSHHVATHGKTMVYAREAANSGNSLKKAMNWPDNLCNSKPIERKCFNCEFWGKTELPKGLCYQKTGKWDRDAEDIACSEFSPNC